MYAAVPRMTPACDAIMLSVGEFAMCAAAGAVSIAFARPKSRTFTFSSGVILTLAGLRSRWTIPCSCAVSSASAICNAMRSASSIGMRRPLKPLSERVAFDQLHDQEVTFALLIHTEERRNVGMVQRREHLGFTLEARYALGISGKGVGKDFDGDGATELGVARAIDLTHAASAERRHDFVDAKP